ncbi:acyl-CoA dehydrogenase family protein [Actinosynnema sp. NPDC047251]|uniref:Acyl-CoA dehydrogenase n=1 Tax=Saccharothrix espanaensis (strain ATCC 51144 / DSM 44229 / JCM 9112 / NBRC 15066 / NRRL 15764) TaxID=1179773 RepID=K0JWX7_SACES|nr:acyl-CoA dehydrogenase family protein [Saccharothrix espanaensis]CCH30546.1 Acyl-CoA dehydrogenase [Saccharothrix espanaensis DSM 44229]
MTALDGRLLALRDQMREWGADFRRLGLALDRDPELIRQHFDLPAVRYLSTMGIPPEYGSVPIPIAGNRFYGTQALERAIIMEELACADVGMLVASPGPLLAGVLVDLLADDAQKEWFYGRMLEAPLWTFFALTEPDRGSDAGALTTTLTPVEGGGVLSGEKRYVGNACRAQLGVVFARVGSGPLGINAVLVETPAEGFKAEALDTIGLRGARISAITLDGVHVPAERFVGRHLSPSRRGMWAFVQTFNLLRPGVAAIALGIARAAHEYVADNRTSLRRDEQDRLDLLGRRIEAARSLVHLAARAVDARTSDGYLASAAKARAAQLAMEATREACGYFGVGARFDHPVLDKLVRDARGMEFIEGTSNMQKLNLFQGLFTGKLDRDDPFRVTVGN